MDSCAHDVGPFACVRFAIDVRPRLGKFKASVPFAVGTAAALPGAEVIAKNLALLARGANRIQWQGISSGYCILWEVRAVRILIIGASQGSGALAAKEALDRGHDVTAFARNPDKLTLNHPKLKKLPGDFHQQSSVKNAVNGQDAVIITASASSLKAFKDNPNFFSTGTRYVIDAMKAEGVRRLVVLSALGTGDSRPLIPFLLRLIMVDGILKRPFADHERQEEMVRASGLDWVIARPGRLTNGPGKKQYVKQTAIEPVPNSISRADVADFLIEAAESQNWVKKAVQIGG